MNDNNAQISQPSLALDISSDGLNYLVYLADGSTQPVTGNVPIAPENYLHELEEVVYSTPALLADYHRTTIAIHSQHFTLMPHELESQAREVLGASFSTIEGDVMTSPAGGGAMIACDVPTGIVAFLRRTFAQPVLLHHLAPLCDFCVNAHALDGGCLHIDMDQQQAHVVVTRDGKLLFANTFDYRSLDDMVYFTLNVWRMSHIDSRSDKIMLSGDKEMVRELAPQLRQWVTYAMPQVFPTQALKFGRDAINIPFNLLLIALYGENV